MSREIGIRNNEYPMIGSNPPTQLLSCRLINVVRDFDYPGHFITIGIERGALICSPPSAPL